MHVGNAFALSTTPGGGARAPRRTAAPAGHAERPAASAGGRAREPIGLTTALGIQQIRWSICFSAPCVHRRHHGGRCSDESTTNRERDATRATGTSTIC